MANIADLIQRARIIRIETKSKKNTADRIGGLLLDIVNGLDEAQSLKKAQYGGIVATSADVVSDYAAKGYSGPYFYLVGSSLSSLVVYQYAGTGSPAQAFGGAAYNFADYSEALRRIDDLVQKLGKEVTGFASLDGSVLVDGKFGTGATYKHAAIPVTAGDVFMLVSDVSYSRYAFATSDASSSGGNIPLVIGTSVVEMPEIGKYYTVTIPSGCTHLLFNLGTGSATRCYKVLSLSETTKELNTRISDLGQKMSEPIVYASRNYALMPTGKYGGNNTYSHSIFPVSAGEIIGIQSASTVCRYALATRTIYNSGADVYLLDGTSVVPMNANELYEVVIPEGCKYFIFNGTAVTTLYRKRNIVNSIANVDSKVSGISKTLNGQTKNYVSGEIYDYYHPSGRGLINPTTYGIRSDYIPASPGVVVTWHSGCDDSKAVFAQFALVYYDAEFNIINCIKSDSVEEKNIIISDSYDTLAYIRASFVKAKKDECFISVDGKEVYRPSDGVVGLIKTAATNKNNIEELVRLLNFRETPINSITERNLYLNSETLKWGASTNYKHALLNLDGIKYVRIIPNNERQSTIAWLTNNDTPVSGNNAPLLDGQVHYVAEETTIKVPSGALYLYIYKGQNNLYSPKYIGIASTKNNGQGIAVNGTANDTLIKRKSDFVMRSANILPTPISQVANDWEQPDNLEVLNVMKRAMQMVRLRWTPKKPYPIPPSGSTARYATAGVEFTNGLPYSNNTSRWKRVGLEVSIHTFMTAINNPYSLCYTEKVDDADHYSIWGEEYWAVNGTGYYGSVCCVFTSASLGIKFNVGNNNHIKSARVLGLFAPFGRQITVDTLNYLKIGDVADDEKHSVLIYGIHRDSNGVVDKVRIAECTSGVSGCRIIDYTASGFVSYINNHNVGNMTLMRYTQLNNHVKYEPSPYVALTDFGETAQTVTYNNDICTFAGDKATFMHGDLVVLNYNLDGEHSEWTHIEVYKDDVLLGTYTLSSIDQSALPEGQQGHALNLGRELVAGKYKARMKNNSNYSDYTYWEVLDDSINVVTHDDGTITVTGNNSGKIAYIMVGKMYETGSGNYMYHGFWHSNCCCPLTFYEQLENKITFNPWTLRLEYGHSYDNTTHIVVMIEGIYGKAATMPISISSSGSETEEEEDDGD